MVVLFFQEKRSLLLNLLQCNFHDPHVRSILRSDKCVDLKLISYLGAGHFRWASLQTTHVLRVYIILLIHGWSEVKTLDTRQK